jgi:hypothetical protein
MRLANVAAAAAAVLMLLAPALWNGFPLLEHDTGGYLARWYEGTLEVSRSTVYGLFLVPLIRPDFWPVIVVQSTLTVWVIALVLRAHGWGGRPLVLLVTVVVLAIATTLPWIASILLTDIFAGLGVLALYLVVLRADTLAGWERVALVILAGFSGATHSATLAVELALTACAALAAPFCRQLIPLAGLGRGIAALVLAPVLLVGANYVVAGQLAWTPGGIALSFGRMLQDGIVARFLADHCPDPRFRLCDHRAVKTGEGVLNTLWHTYAIIEKFTPAAVPAMRAAHQQKGELDFTAINRLHVPVALASLLLLLGVIVLALRRERFADFGPLAATALLALLANAAVCGIFANPHDRYGARLIWIATLVVVLVPWRAVGGEPGRPDLPTLAGSGRIT